MARTVKGRTCRLPYARRAVRISLLLTAVALVSGIALLGLWVVLGVLRDIVTEYRQRRTTGAVPPGPIPPYL